MKLIIDIEKEKYEWIKKNNPNADTDSIVGVVVNGTPYEERPQGKWIKTGSLGNGNAQYECSNCYYNDEQAESQEVPYCWHCGAEMMKGDVK